MQAYNTPPAGSNPAAFELTPFQPKQHKHLHEHATKALAAILPWTWSLTARLGRVWKANKPGYVNGVHSTERGVREARCMGNVALLERRNWYRACEDLPLREKLSARALTLTARRLLTAGDWWKPRSYVDRSTGEVKQTVYLPEDTWSAETALDYCVSFLERLHAAARGMAERMAPLYKPREAEAVRRGGTSALKDSELLKMLQRGYARGAGGQPDLPATS